MASARTGHVEGSRVHHGLRRLENAQVQMKHGPTTSDRFLESEEGAARERAVRDDERGKSRTLSTVRTAGSANAASRRPVYRSGMEPSSARRPLGTQPPISRPSSSATSHAARSAPVCPPETILFTIPAGCRPYDEEFLRKVGDVRLDR
jgi:hypothetical protein